MAERVTMNFKPGSHVLTMQDVTGKEVPIIMLAWDEAALLVRLFEKPKCSLPREICLPCGIRDELIAMIKERGPK
jgi:hypothetical protein